MKKHKIRVPPEMTKLHVQAVLRKWATQHDARVKPMGRLVRRYRTKGESMHWHIAGAHQGAGTIEVTYLPSSGKLTVLVHDNRRGSWAGHAYKDLAHEVEDLVGN